MRYTLIFAGILVLTGCGSLTNNDVESEIEIDTPTSLNAQGEELELFAPTEGDRINLQEDAEPAVVNEGETALGIEGEDLTQAQQDVQEEELVDVTPEVVETITNRVSPVTGPAIPEAQLLEILEAK